MDKKLLLLQASRIRAFLSNARQSKFEWGKHIKGSYLYNWHRMAWGICLFQIKE